jgi:hypothetical protein
VVKITPVFELRENQSGENVGHQRQGCTAPFGTPRAEKLKTSFLRELRDLVNDGDIIGIIKMLPRRWRVSLMSRVRISSIDNAKLRVVARVWGICWHVAK